MNDNSSQDSKLKDEQTAALIAAGAILVFSLFYWVTQIQAVRELLKFASGVM